MIGAGGATGAWITGGAGLFAPPKSCTDRRSQSGKPRKIAVPGSPGLDWSTSMTALDCTGGGGACWTGCGGGGGTYTGMF